MIAHSVVNAAEFESSLSSLLSHPRTGQIAGTIGVTIGWRETWHGGAACVLRDCARQARARAVLWVADVAIVLVLVLVWHC